VSEPERLGQIIARGSGPTPTRRRQRLDLLALNWSHVAGERLGAHSAPRRLVRGTLTIAADGPAWASELSAQSESLKRRAVEVLGEPGVRKVRVQARTDLAPEGVPEPNALPESALAEEAPGLAEDVAGGLGAVEGEELRGALERMLRASITSKQSEQGDG
jgi:hypothetical protein